jgi:transcriptional antiterminator RfaH
MKSWYLLYCKPGEVKRACMHLENQGVSCYYPKRESEKIVRGKKVQVTEPMFPAYLFVFFDYEAGPSFTTVRSTRGVADFVKFGAYPKALEGDLIYTLQQYESSNKHQVQSSLPEKGEVVEVKSGQFAGVDAIFHESDGDKRSILLINIISKEVSVSVCNKDIVLNK